jgi:hypothetical protein
MELALATRKAKTGRALAAAVWQLLFLIAVAYGVAYLVSGCINFASEPASEESRSSAAIQGVVSPLQAELVCGSASQQVRERSACYLPK